MIIVGVVVAAVKLVVHLVQAVTGGVPTRIIFLEQDLLHDIVT